MTHDFIGFCLLLVGFMSESVARMKHHGRFLISERNQRISFYLIPNNGQVAERILELVGSSIPPFFLSKPPVYEMVPLILRVSLLLEALRRHIQCCASLLS